MRLPWYADDESELFYNYFRYYDPATGRYLRSDPIGLEGGLNTYGYVGGSPLMGFDLMGLSPTDVVKIKAVINKSISNMTLNNERFPDKDKNNRCRKIPSFWGLTYNCGENTHKLKDCGEQTEYTIEEIRKESFDDVWYCYQDAGIGHSWGECVAVSNDVDPIIWFDPRANQINENTPCDSCKPWIGSPNYGENFIRSQRGSRK